MAPSILRPDEPPIGLENALAEPVRDDFVKTLSEPEAAHQRLQNG